MAASSRHHAALSVLATILVCVAACSLRSNDARAVETPASRISAGETAHGVITHQVESPYQAGATELRVLTPTPLKAGVKHRVVYVLPVEAERGMKYGDGLREIQRLDLANKFQAIFVAPSFSALPWYADHPTEPTLRQESYLLHVVLPFIERTYPGHGGNYLLGFSKSGWGAWSLLLRHPELFTRAAAWDAPLMKDKPDQFGMGPIFGTQENFEQYQLTKLLAKQAMKLGDKPRLILTGYGGFRSHHQQLHALLDQLKITHVERDGPERKHTWESGWVDEAVGLLLQ